MIKAPEEYLCEENRCDYLITEKMKKVWLVELDLLSELDRVCEKHHLTYYASYGTLIGAIRHDGFIPWDDDIDIIMLRSDYDRLCEVASEEFKYPYFLQNAQSDGFAKGFSRLRNSDTTAITKTYVNHNINQGIFIDIFAVDAYPDDEKVRNNWLKQVNTVYQLMIALFLEETWKDRSLYKRLFLKAFKKIYTLPRLAKNYDKLCSKYSSVKTKYVGSIAFNGGKLKTWNLWESQWFEGTLYHPFEFTKICIPKGYHELLSKRYGNYMIMKKVPNLHGDVLFETDIPYKTFMNKYSRKQIEEMLSKL